MRNLQTALIVALIVLSLVSAGLAQANSYAITNDDNTTANTISVFQYGATFPYSTFIGSFNTYGIGLGGGYFANYGTAVTQDQACVLALDSGSNDLAVFSRLATGFSDLLVNYSNPNMNLTVLGGGVAVSPNGMWVAVAASGSGNVSMWQVGPDCALTYLASYTPSLGLDDLAPLAFTPDGNELVVPLPDFEGIEAFAVDNTSGNLNDLGYVSYTSLPNCLVIGCFPTGFTFAPVSDNVYNLIAGNATAGGGNSVLTATVSSSGVSSPSMATLNTAFSGGFNPNNLAISPDGTVLYVFYSGYNGDGNFPGISSYDLSTVLSGGTNVPENGGITIDPTAVYAGRGGVLTNTGCGSDLSVIWTDSSFHNWIGTVPISGGNCGAFGTIGSTQDPSSVGSYVFSLQILPFAPTP